MNEKEINRLLKVLSNKDVQDAIESIINYNKGGEDNGKKQTS